MRGRRRMTRDEKIAKFWSNVDKTGDCWTWTAATRSGYGAFGFDGKVQRAHRLAWELTRGPIPDGIIVMHACDNPPCVNPDHLRLGTNQDNSNDATERGRMGKLTTDQVVEARLMAKHGAGHPEIAARFGVNRSTISYIVRGDTWRFGKNGGMNVEKPEVAAPGSSDSDNGSV